MPIVNFTGNEIVTLEKIVRYSLHALVTCDAKELEKVSKEIQDSAKYEELIANCHSKVAHEIMYGTDGRGENV